MKKYIHSFLIASALILISFTKSQSIGVGDLLPDIAIPSVINYTEPGINLSDLKGKAIILDFWATWCGPCVDAFPKMDSLQRKFGDKLQILLVNKQAGNAAADFLNKINKVKNISLPSVINDSRLNDLFKHQTVPHYVWINADGVVQAITGADPVKEQNVWSLISTGRVTLPVKKDGFIDSKIDQSKPVLLETPQVDYSESDILYRSAANCNYSSIITKYNPNFRGYSDMRNLRITSLNSTVLWLYMWAYGKGQWDNLNVDQIKTHIVDSAKFIFDLKGKTDKSFENEEYFATHLYNYELIVAPADSSRIYEIMQRDLEKYFDLRGSIEKLPTKTWCLTRTGNEDKLKSKGGKAEESFNPYGLHYKNQELRWFLYDIAMNQTKFPILNETGFDPEKKIDLDITADLKDLNALNKELLKFGLKFIEEDRNKNTIVIREITTKK